MSRRFLFFDADECIGCFACEVACKQEHNIPPGESWIRIGKIGPRKIGEKLAMTFTASRCRHCGRPSCLDECPEGAISKRSDGIVVFNEELCTGCKACIEACPFAAPQYSAEKDVVRACNLCAERIDRGLKPSCAHHCPTAALFFGESHEFTARLAARQMKRREG